MGKSPEVGKDCDKYRSGAVNPLSSLRVELPRMSIGLSTGPDPSNRGTCIDVVIFQPNVPAVAFKLPSEAIMSRHFAPNARHSSTFVAICLL